MIIAPLSLRRRGSWAIADAALSSASNFGLVVFGSHVLDRARFGELAICLAVGTVSVVSVRTLTGEVKLLQREPKWPDEVPTRRGDSIAAMNAVALSVGCGVVIACAGLVVGGYVGRALLALALIMPGLCLQDCIRYLAFSELRPQRAALYDTVWLIMLALFCLVFFFIPIGVPQLLLAWGAAALISCLPFIVVVFRSGESRRALKLSVGHIRAGAPMLVEFWLASGVSQLAFILMAFVASANEVGGVKAILAVYGPQNILYGAAYAAAIPEGQSRVGNRRDFIRLFLGLSCAIGVVTVILTGVLMAAPPLGRVLFGEQWIGERSLVLIAGVGQLALSFGAGAVIGLQAAGKAKTSASIRAALAPLVLCLPLAGAWQAGSRGYLLGYAIASWLCAATWWRAVLRETASAT